MIAAPGGVWSGRHEAENTLARLVATAVIARYDEAGTDESGPGGVEDADRSAGPDVIQGACALVATRPAVDDRSVDRAVAAGHDVSALLAGHGGVDGSPVTELPIAAACVARLLGADLAQVVTAVVIAASAVPATTTVPLSCGRTRLARDAVTAAELALAGMTAHADGLESARGVIGVAGLDVERLRWALRDADRDG